MEKAEVFEKTYQDYLAQLAGIDITERAAVLGGEVYGKEITLPFYGMPYTISQEGIRDLQGKRANFAVSVVLCKYILLCPESIPPHGEWKTYREFKDAGPLTSYFTSNVNHIIETTFSGNPALLMEKSRRLSGVPQDGGATYDLSILFHALPRIPVSLRFNDRDDEFPAQSVILFRQSVEAFLDMESLAIAGTFLAGHLITAPKV